MGWLRPAVVGIALILPFIVAAAAPADAANLTASWTAPTTAEDGTSLTDLDSYNLYYGTTSTPCPGGSFIVVNSLTPAPGPNQTVTATLTGLTGGTLYFASVAAVDMAGQQSACSAVASAVAPNSVPTLTSLSPTSVTAGSAAFTLTANGTNFVNGSVVRWNRASRTTTFVNSTQLTAAITSPDHTARRPCLPGHPQTPRPGLLPSRCLPPAPLSSTFPSCPETGPAAPPPSSAAPGSRPPSPLPTSPRPVPPPSPSSLRPRAAAPPLRKPLRSTIPCPRAPPRPPPPPPPSLLPPRRPPPAPTSSPAPTCAGTAA